MQLKQILLFESKEEFRIALIVIVIFYLSLLIIGCFFSDSLIFPAPKSSYEDTPEIIKLKMDEGNFISALYLANQDSSHVILYSHGNGEDMGDIRPRLEYLKEKGFSIFTYDYPGYGASSGKSSETNAYEAAEKSYKYLTDNLNIPPREIILYGRSLGGGMAIELASKKDVAGLILEGAFLSAFRIMTRFRILPIDKFDNITKIGGISIPILIIHGKRDRVVPFWHGAKLFKAANEPKMSLWLDEAGHNDILDVAGDRYGEAIDKFYKAVREGNGP